MRRTHLLVIVLALLILPGSMVYLSSFVAQDGACVANAACPAVVARGSWFTQGYDLVYTVAFSRAEQPNGPLVVYRASGTDLHTVVPVIALKRGPLSLTPLFFPSPDGRALALLMPTGGYENALQGGTLSLLATDGSTPTGNGTGRRLLLADQVAAGDQVVWSQDGHALYYHSGTEGTLFNQQKGQAASTHTQTGGYNAIHRVGLNGQDVVIVHASQDDSSLRLVGVDHSGRLIVTIARPGQPVTLLRLTTPGSQGTPQPFIRQVPQVVATLPSDILPGNVLRIGTDGASVECERVLSWQPLRIALVHIPFGNQAVSTPLQPLFDVASYGRALTPLVRSANVLVMSQIISTRNDLAVQGIPGVPAQGSLLLADAHTGATQQLTLPYGAQIIQAFWTSHLPLSSLRVVAQDTLAGLLAFHQRLGGGGTNASVNQQDEWMLEAHENLLANGPSLPAMCYGNCPQGFTGTPHVSAAILHGVAYTESNWHQFNTSTYDVNGEPIGSPIESFDGGWGEFQQTWGMPPQCNKAGNCRPDAFKIQHSQSYNIGVGAQSLINAWNSTAGVVSQADPNDPYKANHWFFAVWAYNGSYGNNPNDVPSSQYGKWYPGAPFRSIYEEYVWYFAAHPQSDTSGWTDAYIPSLGSALLPPQSDFVHTSDSFVACASCSIADWTSASYDREWVGVGAPGSSVAGFFLTAFTQNGGEDSVGLPRDNGGGAAIHRWGTGWVQDFGGGAFQPGALLLADGTSTPYWVYGGVWTQYSTVDRGAKGCHGYPTSALSPFLNFGPGSDTYLRQNFRVGSIVWDATTRIVVADLCQ